MTAENEMQQKVFGLMSKYLFGMGIYPNVVGFHNLIDSITCIVSNGFSEWNIGKVFKEIGTRYGKTASSVEKSIRLLIVKCENSGSICKLNEYFGYPVYWENSLISASELVSLFASKIAIELN